MKKLQRQLFKLLRLHSPSGKEGGVRKYLLPILRATMDDVQVDAYGNILAEKRYGDTPYTVLLSAHMDTVARVQPEPKWRNNKTEIYTTSGSALGGDDKCGIAAHLAVIREMNRGTKFSGTVKLIFSREEEIGCVGASRAVKLNPEWFIGIDACIVIDRRGDSDIVTSSGWDNFCSDEYGQFWENVGKKIKGFNPKTCVGSISDTMVFSELGINGVNLSAGYYNAHTKDEYIKIDELKRTIEWTIKAMDTIQNHKFPSFEYEIEYKYSKYNKHSNSTAAYKNYYLDGTRVWDKWVTCDWCRLEWDEHEMVITTEGEHVCPDCQEDFLDDQYTFNCQMCEQDKPMHEYVDYRGFDLCCGCALALDVTIKEG